MDVLAKKIEELNVVLSEQLPLATMEAFQESVRLLDEQAVGSRSLVLGDHFPDFQLTDSEGRLVSLVDLLDGRKLVLVFLRGDWCPYCNLEVHALQNQLSSFENERTRLVGISPQSAKWKQNQSDNIDILCDRNNQLAKTIGINFELHDFVIPHYEALGIDLLKINQTDNYMLPVPAAFVLDENGSVIYKFIKPNYMKRVHIGELLEMI